MKNGFDPMTRRIQRELKDRTAAVVGGTICASFAATIVGDAVEVSGRIHHQIARGIGAIVSVKFEDGIRWLRSSGLELQLHWRF